MSQASEVQYDAAIGLLKKLVLHVGNDELVAIINTTMPGALGKPVLTVLQKELPNESRCAPFLGFI